MKRRELLIGTLSAACLGAPVLAKEPKPMPIIDTHIHLFDPSRPAGVPWPDKDDVIRRTTLPNNYTVAAGPLEIKGAIAIEASPWATDNSWLLDVVTKSPFMVGMVGNLVPGSMNFRSDFSKLTQSKLFKGIRYGNIWNRSLSADMDHPGFIDDLKIVAGAGCVLDTANPDVELIQAVLRVSDRLPELRIVIDHLPSIAVHDGEYRIFEKTIKELAGRNQIFVKLSEIAHAINGEINFKQDYYRDRFEMMFEMFGEDRVLFGSDWPNSLHSGSLSQTVGLARELMQEKSAAVQRKFFWTNSIAAYRWASRTRDQ